MVSTRNNRYKFSDGERVLCYEPDRKKAKVLYDSKVLEVRVRKDSRGRKSVEYLIHFQGWNSSWDRCVTEEYVLKDTEENRKLQRDLADKAQLQQGAYLYRKDQKKRKSLNLSERVLEASNSCSSQEGSNEEPDYSTATDDEKETCTYDSDESIEQVIPIDITPGIRMLLERDYALINSENKLLKLPATPTVVQVLESYVRHSCCCLLRQDESNRRPRSRPVVNSQPVDKTEELEWICARVNLCKELVDGLRICFDYYLGSQLLYTNELAQYQSLQTDDKSFHLTVKQEMMLEDDTSRSDDPFISGRDPSAMLSGDTRDVDRRRSLRSHKDLPVEACPANGVSKLTATNLGTLGGHPSINHCSAKSTSSTSSTYSPMAATNAHQASGAGPLSAEMEKLIALTNSWHLVPDYYLKQKPPPPSAVYGATHLARLFVKLPSFLHAANLPETENQPRFLSEQKLKLLLNHLHSFLIYLEEKQDWFTTDQYMDNPSLCESV